MITFSPFKAIIFDNYFVYLQKNYIMFIITIIPVFISSLIISGVIYLIGKALGSAISFSSTFTKTFLTILSLYGIKLFIESPKSAIILLIIVGIAIGILKLIGSPKKEINNEKLERIKKLQKSLSENKISKQEFQININLIDIDIKEEKIPKRLDWLQTSFTSGIITEEKYLPELQVIKDEKEKLKQERESIIKKYSNS